MQQPRTLRCLAALPAGLALVLCVACAGITEGGSDDTLPPLVPGNTGPPVTQGGAIGPDGQPVVNTQGSTTTAAISQDPSAIEADDANPASVATRFLAAVESDDSAVGTPLALADRDPTVFDWARGAYQQYTQLAGADSWGDPTCSEPGGATVSCSWLTTDAAPTLMLVQEGSNWRVSHPVFTLAGEPAAAGSGCVVGGDSVNFRGGPGTSWPRFTQLAPNTCQVTVFDAVENDPIEGQSWRYIEVNGQRGWVVDRVVEIG